MKLSDVKLFENESELYSLNELNGLFLETVNSEKFYRSISHYCKPWLDDLGVSLYDYVETKDLHYYRGTKDSFELAKVKPVRKDRKPLDTPAVFNKAIDDSIRKHGGVANRSNSAFITKSKDFARRYGNPYLILPVGEFHTTVLQGVEDLYRELNKVVHEITNDKHFNMQDVLDRGTPEAVEEVMEAIDLIIETHIRTDINLRVYDSKNEVMLSASNLIYLNDYGERAISMGARE
jgi:hypothetical protein